MIIAPTDPRLSWHGQVSFESTESYTRPWRIPFEQKTLFAPQMWVAASSSSGVRLALRSSTRQLAGRIQAQEAEQKLDLCLNGQFHGSENLTGKDEFCFGDLPAGEKELTLWLPQAGGFFLRELEVDDDATLEPAPDSRPRWITYGSSITHCGAAASPSRTWPAIVAQERNLNLTSLGFGGQCHLDVQMARTMRDLPADYISICAGINIYGNNSLNARTFGPALIGFVQVLREKHPETPILLISPIYSFDRETTPNAVGWTLVDYRNAVAEAAQTLQDAGDQNVHYCDGLQLLSAEAEALMPDRLHPDAAGYEALARNFLDRAAPILFGDSPGSPIR